MLLYEGDSKNLKNKISLLNKTLVIVILVIFVEISVAQSISGEVIKNNEELVVTVTTDKDIYYLGEPVTITISVTNYGPSTTLVFPDTQLADFEITKLNGGHIYKWAWHFGFFQVVTNLPIKHGETIVLLQEVWYKLRDFYPFFPLVHFPVLPGKFLITGWMVDGFYHSMIKGEPIEVTSRWFKFN